MQIVLESIGGVEQSEIAAEALNALFEVRPDNLVDLPAMVQSQTVNRSTWEVAADSQPNTQLTVTE
jgi:hypothetical protein